MKRRYIVAAVIVVLIIVYVFWMMTCLPRPSIRPLTENGCKSLADSACASVGKLPSGWAGDWKNTFCNWGLETCQELLGCSSCEECGFQTS